MHIYSVLIGPGMANHILYEGHARELNPSSRLKGPTVASALQPWRKATSFNDCCYGSPSAAFHVSAEVSLPLVK